MTPNNQTDSTEVERLLRRQRPPAAGEPLPAMPDDLRHQWQTHFTPQSHTTSRQAWVWVCGLAAAAVIVVSLACLDFLSPPQVSPSQQSVANALLSLQPFPPGSDPRDNMSPTTLALLHYQDPAYAGLDENE